MAVAGLSGGETPRHLAPPPAGAVAPLDRPPTFSVVIAAYEAAGTIGAALSSALEQTHPPHEVIVVDDGSEDDLAAAVAPFADRVTLLRQENRGAGPARNTAIAAAGGEFAVILDADDRYRPRRLEALAELATARPDLDMLSTDARLLVGGQAVETFATHTPFAVENQRTAILESCFVGGWPAIRRSRFEAIGGFDESLRIAQDWDCWLRAILDGAVAGFVDEPLYDYVLHGGSLASSRVRSLRERVAMLENAGRNPSLRPEERPALERALRRHRAQAAQGAIEAAAYGDGSRGEAARLVLSRGIGPRARALAALTAAAPSAARRYVPRTVPPEERFGVEAG
jgi:Glycosyl transferase family 2